MKYLSRASVLNYIKFTREFDGSASGIVFFQQIGVQRIVEHFITDSVEPYVLANWSRIVGIIYKKVTNL